MTDRRPHNQGDGESGAAPEPAGFARLLWVDAASGRHNGNQTIYVPSTLAEGINAARSVLYSQSEDRAAWVRAGVTRTIPFEDDAGDTDSEFEAASILDSSLSIPPLSLQSRKAMQPVAAAQPEDSKRQRRPRSARGRHVRVVSAAAIALRRKDVQSLLKYSAAEKKAEQQVMDDLLARGEYRLVGMSKDWRDRLALLRSDMPNFSLVVERIEAACAVAEFSRTPLRIPPLLLAGPPGVGKTHFALRLSEILGVPKFVYPLESAETVAALCGSDRHWANSEPGELYKLIVQGEYANPVVVLDEIDKANPGSSYRPTSALHAVLEPITASKLRDKSIQLEFDASFVVYIATANRLSPIETSLVSRFELFHIELPGPRGAVSIARSIGHQAIKELRLEKRFAAPAGEVVQQLALIGCPRRMLKALKAAIGRAVLAGRRWLAVRDLVPGDGNDPLQ